MQLNFLARHSIKTRVTLSTMAIFLASLWSLSFYASVELKNDMREELSAQQYATVSLLARQVDERLTERLLWLQLVAKEITPERLNDPAALKNQLDQQPILRREFNESVLVVNAKGYAIAEAPTDAGRVGRGRLNLPSVNVALNESRVSIGQVFVDAGLGAPLFGISVPIQDASGQTIGAITGLTNLRKPNFLRIVTNNNFGRTGGYVLVDPLQRRVITATDTSRIMEALPSPGVNPTLDHFINGFQGSLVLMSPQGQEILASDKTVPSSGWVMSATLPTEEAFAPMRAMQQRMFYTTLLLTLLAGGLTWWLVRHQLAPVLNTIRAIGRSEVSEGIPRSLPVGAPGEIGELIRAFNTLLATLAQRNQKLQAQQDVLSRTEALAHVGSWEWDIDSDTVTWSDELFQFFRRDPAKGAPTMEQLPTLYIPHDAQHFKEAVNKALHYGIPYELELRSMRRDGSQRYYLARGEVQRNARREVSKLVGSLQDITDLKQIQETLQHSYTALQAVLQTTLDGFYRADKQGRLLQVNPAYCAMSGYSEDELLQMSVLDLEATENTEEVAERIVRLYRTGREQFETCHRRKDGSLWNVEASLTVNINGGGDMFAFLRDITERKRAQLHLEMSASVFSHAHEGISITDVQGYILNVNDTFCQITGYSRAEVIGKHTRLLKSERQDRGFYEAMWKALLVNGHWSGEIWNRRKNGEIYPELLTISAVRDEQGVTRQYVALFSDISARKAIEDRVRQLAFFDALTDLPNRRLLTDRLSQILLANKRNGHFGAVMFLDLDNFKPLNDTYGHAFGDLLLIEVAQRLKASVREVDTVARLGGDEFVVVLSELDTTMEASKALAMTIAEKIRQSLSEVYRLARASNHNGNARQLIEHHCTASLGVAVFDPSQTDQEIILHQADEAMYRAKEAGRNQVVLHEPSPQTAT
ncbi:PAS domain S-box protein [Rhodoferax sp.]|uniref:sensor domain-containing diguanylate cyclase n=1 Tax=Rhodoferax sp. TaxID=50421 RepID=UPI00284C80A2|nr:PAS domain S-box protein [Rhodoferax sp.]MDR3370654.1 PAS domain S-box protein [Rhodoferax sp.]